VRSRGTLVWVVIALLFVDLTFFSGASNFLASPQSRILNQLLILGVAVGAGIAALRGRIELRSSLILPGAAWIAANAIATVTSARPAASIEALALLLISVPAYFVIRAILADDFLRSRIDRLFVVATTIFVVAYLLQCLTQWLSWWSIAGPSIPPLRPGDVGLTVGTVNAVALYLELMTPIAIWLSWTIWRSRPFTIALTVLSAVALLVTGSRGAWVGAAAGVVVALLLAWRESGVSIRSVLGTIRGRVVAVVLVLALVAAVPLVAPRLLLGDEGRLELWSAAWSMIASSPIVGVGPGSWPDLRASTPISDDIFAVLATSHNSVLQTLTDAGIIGLLAGLWLVIAIARLGWRALAPDRPANARRLAIVAGGSLVACGVHSVVDTQFHIPAIVLLVFHLVARLELAAGLPDAGWAPSRRAVLAMSGALVIVGLVRLVPIDIAMVRAASGNQALDRGDAITAAQAFDDAIALHDLPAYRLGQAIARRDQGDDSGALESLTVVEAAEPFTFVIAQRAMLEPSPSAQWQDADRAEAYDATAGVNLAAQRLRDEPDAAENDLAWAMFQVPTLYYSKRPEGIFDADSWGRAQSYAQGFIEDADPVTAAAVTTLANQSQVASSIRASIPPGPESDALDLLDAAVGGHPVSTDDAVAILREAPDSTGVQFVLWQLGFVIKSQPLLDAVKAVSVPLTFNVPPPPMELVMDGRVDADYSVRLPRWPQASAGRNGPKRPYIKGFITIEPVFRPK
jgi:O-antigen ligase